MYVYVCVHIQVEIRKKNLKKGKKKFFLGSGVKKRKRASEKKEAKKI